MRPLETSTNGGGEEDPEEETPEGTRPAVWCLVNCSTREGHHPRGRRVASGGVECSVVLASQAPTIADE
jgi:hypothetical protein